MAIRSSGSTGAGGDVALESACRSSSYRDHQPDAVAAILKHQQGIYEAPTGSGKSTVGCAVIWRSCPRKAHILVDKKELMYQWQAMLVKHNGMSVYDIGQIGDGQWAERRVDRVHRGSR